MAIETSDVIHTRDVSGDSKFILSTFLNRALAMAVLRKYAAALATSMAMRITKIHTSNCTCTTGFDTPSRMNVINATPVTP